VVQLEFYNNHLQRLWGATCRIRELCETHWRRMPGAAISEVLAAMSPQEHDEVERLSPIAFPTGYIYLPHECNTGGGR